MQVWGGRCAITGAQIPALLRASHIKPWSSSDNRERLDPHNGLLLLRQYDVAFDIGLISFESNGTLVSSGKADLDGLRGASIDISARLREVRSEHAHYLRFHRENIFQE
jgi:hypothetical protein